MYCGEDGGINTYDFEIPFSQFTELDDAYEESATSHIVPVITGVEIENAEDGSMVVKAGISGQYVVYDCTILECVADAYSIRKDVKPLLRITEIPIILDSREENLCAETFLNDGVDRVVDVAFYPDHPRITKENDHVTGEFPCVFQALYYDTDGRLQGVTTRWDGNCELVADEDVRVQMRTRSSKDAQVVFASGKVSLCCEFQIETESRAQKGLEMACGLFIGDTKARNQDVPSLVLRKMGDDSLWDIAKETGSTVESIQKANKLIEEPSSEQMLLIPIL
jgi:hypothetical protein